MAAACASSALGQQFSISPNEVYDGINFTFGNSYIGPSTGSDSAGAVLDGGYDAFDGWYDYDNTFGGLSLNRRTETLSSINVYRAIDTFTNNTADALSVPIRLIGNLGSDGGEVFLQNNGYSSITHDSFLEFNFGDPIVGYMNGNNAWTLGNIVRMLSGDYIYTDFTLTLQPGESISLMFATFLARDITDRSGDAALALSTVNGMLADPMGTGLYTGLTQSEINSIVNWVPSPSAVALLGIGGLASLRRRR